MSGCSTAFAHPLLVACFQAAQASGAKLVLVGGAVRDVLAGKPLPDDLDFLVLDQDIRLCIDDLVSGLMPYLDKPARPVLLDKDWGIVRLVVAWQGQTFTVDLANALDNNIDADLRRRDVTVNAIGWDGNRFIDPLNGRKDLARLTVRQIDPSNFQDDPLRVLRVFRTASMWPNTTITPDTLTSCQTYADGLNTVAKERILTEWLKLLGGNNLVLLMPLFPPALTHLFTRRDNPQPVLAHWQQVLQWYPALLKALNTRTLQGFSVVNWLTWVALDPTLSHIELYPLSRDTRRFCQQVVAIGSQLTAYQVSQATNTVEQAALWRQWGQETPAGLLYWLFQQPEKMHVDAYFTLWQHYHYKAETLPPLVDGQRLMQDWGLLPGPTIGQTLDMIRDAQLAELIYTADDAKSFWQQRTGQQD